MNQYRCKLGTIVAHLLVVTTTVFIAADLAIAAQPAIIRPASLPKFRSTTGKFTIAFPKQPQLKRQQDSNGNTIYNFVTNDQGRSYLVSYFDQSDLKNSSRPMMQSFLFRIVNGFTEGAEMKIVQAQTVNLGKHPGREFNFTGAGNSGKGRAYLVGTRVYLLVGIDRARSVNSFLNSFRLL